VVDSPHGAEKSLRQVYFGIVSIRWSTFCPLTLRILSNLSFFNRPKFNIKTAALPKTQIF
jgi:hypothetical protein